MLFKQGFPIPPEQFFSLRAKGFSHSDRKVPELWALSQQKLVLNWAKTTWPPTTNFQFQTSFWLFNKNNLTNLTIGNVNLISISIEHTCRFQYFTDDHRPDYKLDPHPDRHPDRHSNHKKCNGLVERRQARPTILFSKPLIIIIMYHPDHPFNLYILIIRNVTAWWRDDWPDLPSTFPIHDFVRSTNMVQVCKIILDIMRRNYKYKKTKKK